MNFSFITAHKAHIKVDSLAIKDARLKNIFKQ